MDPHEKVSMDAEKIMSNTWYFEFMVKKTLTKLARTTEFHITPLGSLKTIYVYLKASPLPPAPSQDACCWILGDGWWESLLRHQQWLLRQQQSLLRYQQWLLLSVLLAGCCLAAGWLVHLGGTWRHGSSPERPQIQRPCQEGGKFLDPWG